MCNSCKQLHFYDNFRSILQYSHEIGKIRALVALGDMEVTDASVPLDEIRGEPQGYYRHELCCKLCGQKFVIWLDTAEKRGGARAIDR